MYTIRTLNAISQVIYESFPEDKYTISGSAENYDAVIVRSADMHEMQLPKDLVAIARAGAGYNNIPVERCTNEGIVVFNTPGGNANSVAEMAIGTMIAASRNAFAGAEWVKTLKGNGDKVGALAEKGKGAFVGREIRGKKLAVIGLGAVGGRFANMAYNLKMSVVGFDPYLSVDAAWRLSRGVRKSASIEEAIESADFVSVHVPYMPSTKNYIDAKAISALKDGAVLLNFSRGELVDGVALREALKSGKISKYVTDFAEDDLLDNPSVITFPHLGASTPESEDNCADMAASQIAAYLENGSIMNSVNYPACELAHWSGERLCLLHKNIPNMITQISSAIGSGGVNIEHMMNKSRGDVAYSVLDLGSPCGENVLESLRAIDGIYKVRMIKGS